MKKLDWTKVVIGFFIIILYLIIVNIVPFGEETLNERRDWARFDKITDKEKFNKIQAFVVCIDKYDGGEVEARVERFGAESLEVCNVMHDSGWLSDQHLLYIKLETEELESGRYSSQYADIIADINAKAKGVAAAHIYSKMNDMDSRQYFPVNVYLNVKRKWYHFFLL